MLTVDYERLELHSGHKVLDLGCGFGRHAYESLRRGAEVIACDMALPELGEVRATYAAMLEATKLTQNLSPLHALVMPQLFPFPTTHSIELLQAKYLNILKMTKLP